MNVIAVANQKGGVAKTTTTEALGHTLASKGYKVLMIDLDPQGDLSMSSGLNTDKLDFTITDAFISEYKGTLESLNQHIISLKENLDILPSNIDLAAVDMDFDSHDTQNYFILDRIVNRIIGYDYILIDCCPSLGILTLNAFSMANRVLIPTAPELFSAKGLERLLSTIANVKRRINQKLEIEGILFTRTLPHLNLTKLVKEEVREAYGSHLKIFETHIPQSTQVGLSLVEQGKSVMFRNCKNPVIEAYEVITEEIISNFPSVGIEVKEEK